MTTPLVSLEEAKDQVFSTQVEDDSVLSLYASLATGIVIDRVGLDPVTGAARTWTETTVPDTVKAAILQQIAEMWAHRGDEQKSWVDQMGRLSPSVERLLVRIVDPVVA